MGKKKDKEDIVEDKKGKKSKGKKEQGNIKVEGELNEIVSGMLREELGPDTEAKSTIEILTIGPEEDTTKVKGKLVLFGQAPKDKDEKEEPKKIVYMAGGQTRNSFYQAVESFMSDKDVIVTGNKKDLTEAVRRIYREN